LGSNNGGELVPHQQEQIHDNCTKGCSSQDDCSRKYIPAVLKLTIVTVILVLVSAALASRPGEDTGIETVDPRDSTKTIVVEERYPGESQWSAPTLLKLILGCHKLLLQRKKCEPLEKLTAKGT
jgi:hypothetical protein